MATSHASSSVIEAIHERASVRSFAPHRVERESVKCLIDAAVRAPTAVREEPWQFVVIQDAKLLKRISDRAKPFFVDEISQTHFDPGGHALEHVSSPEFNIFYNAGTLIVICGPSDLAFVAADCWLAAENLILAAHAMGFASCVIGSALGGLNAPEVKAELRIPPDISAIAPIIVGIPEGRVRPTPRREPRILIWKE